MPVSNSAKGRVIFFIIVAIIFDDSLEAEKTAVAIKSLKRKIGFSDNREFKFNKLNKEIRIEFFREINNFKFKIECLIIDKKALKNNKLSNNKDSFYTYAVKIFLKRSATLMFDTNIKLDGSGDRIFKRNFFSYLRKELGQKERRIIRNMRFVDSKGNQIIQLTDMIAGAVRRSCDENKSDKNIYKNIFKKHIDNEWSF